VTSPLRVKDIAIITSGRIGLFRRCLESFLKQGSIGPNTATLTVFNDSVCPETLQEYHSYLLYLKNNLRVDVRYADLTSTSRFAAQLESRGCPKKMVAFALYGYPDATVSPGRNRNAALIHFAGDAFLSSDDDIVCNPVSFHAGKQNIRELKHGSSSLDTYFFTTVREATMAAPRLSCDLLAEHCNLLGMTHKATFDEENHRPEEIENSRSQVLLTSSGVIGDSGIPHPLSFLLARDPIRMRFRQAAEDRGTVQISRSIIRGTSYPAVTRHGPFFTTTVTGFDNRHLLPPFLPSNPGEDTLFGVLLTIAHTNAYWGHVPVGHLHDPGVARTYALPPSAPDAVHVMIDLALQLNIAAAGADNRLIEIGKALEEFAACDEMTFAIRMNIVRSRIVNKWTAGASALVALGSQVDDSSTLALRSWLAAMTRSLDEQSFLSSGNGFNMMLASNVTLQRLMLDYGQLLQYWPRIIKSALELRGMGTRLASIVQNGSVSDL